MDVTKNPLGTRPIGKLLFAFALPSIIAMLVSALYNIVDQFFIGNAVGPLGNAATNVAFPLTTACVAISLLFGIGGASAFNLALGRKDPERALRYMGNALSMAIICAIVLIVVVRIFLRPLLIGFGSSQEVLPYAETYTGITSFGFLFNILTVTGGHLVRADGRPRASMICNIVGAIVNVALDALFVFGFNMGIAGAAYATVIGMGVSAATAVFFLSRNRTVKLNLKALRPHKEDVLYIMKLGTAPCINQISLVLVQIALNNSLKYYGGMSVYGESIPIACAGIITKVNMIYMSCVIGVSQGLQPIVSFNYGARNFDRVKKAYLRAIFVTVFISVTAFLCFQLLPREIISLFGEGSEEYYNFAIRIFRIYLFFTFLNFMQPISSNFFTAIGKPLKGTFLSLTRQIIFLVPLILILPVFLGIDGIVFSAPIADFMAITVSCLMVFAEFRKMKKEKDIG